MELIYEAARGGAATSVSSAIETVRERAADRLHPMESSLPHQTGAETVVRWFSEMVIWRNPRLAGAEPPSEAMTAKAAGCYRGRLTYTDNLDKFFTRA